jgi:ComF family protein
VVNGWTTFVQVLLPPSCVLCGGQGQPPGLDLCKACADELPVNSNACERCGDPLAGNVGSATLCGACLTRRPHFHQTHCAFRYAYPIDHMVRTLKYQGRIVHGRVLGQLLAQSLAAGRKEPWPQCVVPMPLADERFRDRGYNQAVEIGLPLESLLGVPLRTDLVVRQRQTREQTALSRKERRKNVRGAFAVTGILPATHLAVLDDVVTTGSTANELARILRRAGAKRVEVWAVAHAER